MRATLGALIFCACYSAPVETLQLDVAKVPPPATPDPKPADDPKIVCDMSKFSFTQEIGCVNDGWVEFCADKSGAPVVTALRAISPDVSILEGVIGRAGCNTMTEYLVSQPVKQTDCMAPYGALTDAAWNTLCALSQVPETKHFVPGFSE